MIDTCKVNGCAFDAVKFRGQDIAVCLTHYSHMMSFDGTALDFLNAMNHPPAEPATAPKKNEGKPKLRYLSPEFLLSIARAMTWGEGKYPAGNYLKLPSEDLYDSMLRHMLEVVKDKDSVDSESGLKHLDHFKANVLMWTENLEKKG